MTEWIFFIIPYLNYVALVRTGMLVWVLDATRVSWQEPETGRCAGLNFLLSSGSAAFQLCACHCAAAAAPAFCLF